MRDKITYLNDPADGGMGTVAFCAARVMDELLAAKLQLDSLQRFLVECEADVEVAWVTTGQVREAVDLTDVVEVAR